MPFNPMFLMQALGLSPQIFTQRMNDANNLQQQMQMTPEEIVKQKLQSGELSQQEFENYAQQARQILGMGRTYQANNFY